MDAIDTINITTDAVFFSIIKTPLLLKKTAVSPATSLHLMSSLLHRYLQLITHTPTTRTLSFRQPSLNF